jgi:arylsulfatase
VYTFELRRFPAESGLSLQASLPETRVTDGNFEAAKALSIAKGRIRIGAFEATAEPDETLTTIRFSTALQPGPVELQTWMLDVSGREICGAYYVTVTRR